MPTSKKVAVLGSKIQYLAADLQYSLDNDDPISDAQDELLDTIEDLHTELVGPMKWTATFLTPPDFSVMQVAFEYKIFQHVPMRSSGKEKQGAIPSISVRELASLINMDEGFLLRIMRLLAVNNIFREVEEKVFAHTTLSAGMADDLVSAHLGGLLYDVYKACTSLSDALKGGYPNAWVARFGVPMYEYFEKGLSPDRERLAKSMAVANVEEVKEVAKIFPWEHFHKVVDIGGGPGHLAAELASQHSHLQTVNQDLPNVIDDTMKRTQTLPPPAKVSYDRVEFETHNYYDPQPRTDADAFILRRCLHNNSDSDCIRILRAVVPGLEAGGPTTRLLVIEKILPAWNAYSTRHKTKMLRREDIIMMISAGGKERTLEEFQALAAAADERFQIDQVYPSANHYAVLVFKLGHTNQQSVTGASEQTTVNDAPEQSVVNPGASDALLNHRPLADGGTGGQPPFSSPPVDINEIGDPSSMNGIGEQSVSLGVGQPLHTVAP